MIPSAFLHERFETVELPQPRAHPVPPLRPLAVVAALAGAQCAAFGLSWDVLWHLYVGPDRLETPPHLVLYGGILLAGLAFALDIVFETLAARRGRVPPGTVAAFGFRAPRGVLLGMGGVVTVLLASAFDNLWHGWYGFDLSLWAPFHLMALFGHLLIAAGLAYACAELARRQPAFHAGVYLALAGGCDLSFLFAEPALRSALVAGDGFSILPAALICAFGMTLFALAAAVYAGDSRAALAVFALYIVRDALFRTFGPLFTHDAVAHAGLMYRVPGFEPPLSEGYILLSLTLLVPGLVIAFARERTPSRGYAALAAFFVTLAACVWVAAAQSVVVPIAHTEAPLPLEIVAKGTLLTAPLGAAIGVLIARPARGFGRLLRA